MKREEFICSVHELLPVCSQEAVPIWIKFAEENVESNQYVDFTPIAENEAAISKWLESIYAGLYFVKNEFGENTATQVCDLSLTTCVYPSEMRPSAQYLKCGWTPEHFSEFIESGLLETDPPYFPNLEDIARSETEAAIKQAATKELESSPLPDVGASMCHNA